MSNNPVCPWPGPIPYSEAQADIYFGRHRECKELEGRLIDQQLTILIARSGVGKTSLLRAGLLPFLLKQHAKVEEESSSRGPVLLIRDWGNIRDQSRPQLILDKIVISIAKLKSHINGLTEDELKANDLTTRDVDVWRQWIEVLEPIAKEFANQQISRQISKVDLVRCLRQMCDKVGSLVLIVDQFEELLGAGSEDQAHTIEQDTVDLFSEIFLRAKAVRVLLAMRDDYVSHLSGLGLVVNGLDRRQFRLEPMTSTQALRAASAAAGKCGVTILPIPTNPKSTSDVLEDISSTLKTVTAWVTGSNRLELIELQALLKDIFDFAVQQSESQQSLVIDENLLVDYKEQFPGIDANDLANAALERHIILAFSHSQASSNPRAPGDALIRRIAARMAPWLTTARGYKRSLTESELLFQAVKADIESLSGLRVSESDLSDWLLRKSPMPTSLHNAVSGRDNRVLSGDAMIGPGWNLEIALETIVDAATTAISGLTNEKRNVLKRSRSIDGNSDSLELVHDALGPAFRRFSDTEQNRPHYHLASLAPLRGLPLWPGLDMGKGSDYPFPGLIRNQKWLGCDLFEVNLSGVIFQNCDFSGTIFRNCKLIDCTFTECIFRGAVFLGGIWVNVNWKDCEAESMLMKEAEQLDADGNKIPFQWQSGNYEGCNFDGATISHVKVIGNVSVSDSSFNFAQIRPLQENTSTGDTGNRLTIVDSELNNALLVESSRWDYDKTTCQKTYLRRNELTRKYPSRMSNQDQDNLQDRAFHLCG